jgi:vesicle-associated membrane protein 7
MSLIYGLVARGSTILAEHTNSSGNFASGKRSLWVDFVNHLYSVLVTQAILDKIPPNNSKLTYVFDR